MYRDLSCHKFMALLQSDFCIDHCVICRLLVQQLAILANDVFNVWNDSCRLIIIFIRFKIFVTFMYDCIQQIDQCPPSPLNQFIKDFSFLDLDWTVDFSCGGWSEVLPGDHLSISLQNLLHHFVPFSQCGSKDTAKDLLGCWVRRHLVLEVTPILPLVLTQIGYVAFFSIQCHVSIHTMKRETVFHSKVVYSSSPLKTIIPKDHRRSGFVHVLVSGFLQQTDIELSFIQPRCTFLKCSNSGADIIAEMM